MVVESFIALKYQLPTEENFSLDNRSKCNELLNTYPKEVLKNWAWRCAEDVEHLAKGDKKAEECIAYAKSLKHKMGDLSQEERKKLDELWGATYAAYAAAAGTAHAAATTSTTSTAYAAYTATTSTTSTAYTATTAAATAYAAAADAYYAATAAYAYYATTAARQEKWAQYRLWLIEELCRYEEKTE